MDRLIPPDAKRIRLPLDEPAARELRAGDVVVADGEIVITAGIPTLERLSTHLDQQLPLPIDLSGVAMFHLGSYSQETEDGLEIRYMNPTTSTRFNPVMPRLIRDLRLHAIGGKGGLSSECRQALAEVGGVYLSFLGGGAPIWSAAIREVLSVDWDDLIAHYRLVRLRVEELGPLTVAIDAHGQSIYEQVAAGATDRLPEIRAAMRRDREELAQP